MREINESKEVKGFTNPALAVAVGFIVGIGVGYAYQASKIADIQDSLLETRTKVSLLTAREQSLSADLDRASHLASSRSSESVKIRQELAALNQELSGSRAQAKANEQRLQATIESLNAQVASANKRANDLAKAIDPQKLNEIEGIKKSKKASAAPTKENMVASRINELLEKFDLTSDEFTRPRAYLHTALSLRRADCSNKESSCGKCAFLDLKVDTDGNLFFGGYKFGSLQVLHDGDVIKFYKLEELQGTFEHEFSDARSLRCRLMWEYLDIKKLAYFAPRLSSSFGSADFDLNADDLMALRETFELAQSFKARK